jgi:hypothetical protein
MEKDLYNGKEGVRSSQTDQQLESDEFVIDKDWRSFGCQW